MTSDTAPVRNVLPEGLTAYKRTPTFDQDTLPIGLRHEHRTKAGVCSIPNGLPHRGCAEVTGRNFDK